MQAKVDDYDNFRPRNALGYQPALDGIRALAVLSVMAYHQGWSIFPAGFLGVDIFFVLSGFLITYLLIHELQGSGRIALGRFWLGRARRLLPAVLLVVLVIAAFAAVAGTAAERDVVRSDGLASLFYIQNWHLVAKGTSYFAQFGEQSPFLHMWSLAIEEQFYLLWPLSLFGLFRLTRHRVGRVTLIVSMLALCSAVWMALVSTPGGDPSRAYYGTDTRAQALMIGSVVACLFTIRPKIGLGRSRLLVQGLGALGVGFLAFAIVEVTQSSDVLYQGGFTAVALAAAAVITAAMVPGPIARLLAIPPLPAIGRMSYGLYLWSWPITVYFTADRIGVVGTALSVVQLGTTFAVAALSYVLVEGPVRRGFQRGRRAPRARISSALAAVVAVPVVLVVATSGLIAASPPTDTEIIAGAARAYAGSRAASRHADVPLVFVAGDSVSYTLALGFPEELSHKIQPAGLPFNGCALAPGVAVADGVHQAPVIGCDQRLELTTKAVHKAHPDVVVLVPTAWDLFDRDVDGHRVNFGTPESEALMRTALDVERAALSPDNQPFLLLTTPCYGVYEDLRVFGARERAQPWRVRWMNEVLRRYAADHPDVVHLADLHAVLCPRGKYAESVNGARVRSDGVHLTLAGAAYVWRWLTPIVRQLAHPPAAATLPQPALPPP